MSASSSTPPGAGELPVARLYQEHAPAILAYIRLRTATREEAEDLLLDVFLAALEHGEMLEERPVETQRAWLRSFAAHKIADHYRRGRGRQRVTVGLVAETLDADIVALGPDDVWAVGTSAPAFSLYIDVARQGQGLVEHWDGQQRSLIANPTPRPFTSLSGVAGDPSVPGKVWIAGLTGPALSQGDQLSNTRTLIETNQ